MTAVLIEFKSQLRWLAFDWKLRLIYAFGRFPLLLASMVCRGLHLSTTSVRLLLAAHRTSRSAWLDQRIASNLGEISRTSLLFVSAIESANYPRQRCMFLRSPVIDHGQLISKGVLFVKFTTTSGYLAKATDLRRLAKYFWIVIEPSSAGYADPYLLLWYCSNSTTFVQATDIRDEEFLRALAPAFVALPFGSSDWVDPRVFRPLGLRKTYDVVYVAGLNVVKRLHVFALAVRELRNTSAKDPRAALVISSWGRSSNDELSALLRWHSITSCVDVYRDVNHADVNNILNLSHVSLMLSRKEGASRTLPESLFAGTPVILSSCNIGVRRDLVNSSTGVIVDDRDLPEAIAQFRDGRFQGNPARWARENIAPAKTIGKLAGMLESYDGPAASTSTLWPKVNAPEMRYFDSSVAAVAPDADSVLKLFAHDSLPTDSVLAERIRIVFAPMRSLDRASSAPCNSLGIPLSEMTCPPF